MAENPTVGQKIRIFFFCVKKNLLVNYFQKCTVKVPASSHFCEILESQFQIPLNQPKWPMEFCAKLHIFNRPVQNEENLPGFRIHAVCNLHFDHSSELKAS